MNWRAPMLAVLLAAPPLQAVAAQLDLHAYQDPHGALTVYLGGTTVDPYFALRALLSGADAGLETAQPAQAMIAWMLARQQADGSFARYCRTPGAEWHSCAAADADDALLAMWAQLLYASAPCSAMPRAWRASAARALDHLERLRDRQRGTYRIDRSHSTSLLMDNAEIYGALVAISKRQRCMGQARAATLTARRATALAQAIGRVFQPRPEGPWRASTQDSSAQRFYPDQVAQLYPILFGLTGGATARRQVRAWLDQHGATWLERGADHYPWGLAALAAQAVGADDAAQAWLERAAALRHGAHWNILEEAAWQALCLRQASHVLACRVPLAVAQRA